MQIIIIIILALIAISFIISSLLIYDMKKAENEHELFKQLWEKKYNERQK